MISKSKLLRWAVQRFTSTDECGVVACPHTDDVDVIALQPFDPIDHDETFVALCAHHREWADERNAFAEEMADELREARKEIGQEHIGQIQSLAMPQDGELREDILMGDVDEPAVPLEDAFEDRPAELDTGEVRGLLTGDEP